MRVECPNCSQKAVITSSTSLSSTVKDLYCQCINTEHCGASFVYTLAFKHTLNPPINTTREMALQLIKNLPVEERQAVQNELFG